ncbi:RDD family protein [Hutsoniella sourekii]|uniref:RDD family protein n=1 Tax=Hutsoniella sourekii TaxID=87650 RepID=UPI000480981E|nr:RDD family protein [Hutsoniella sourekii]
MSEQNPNGQLSPVSLKGRWTSLLADWLIFMVHIMAGLAVIMVANYINRIFWRENLPIYMLQVLVLLLVCLPYFILNLYFDRQLSASLGKQLLQQRVCYRGPARPFVRNFLKTVLIAISTSGLLLILTQAHRRLGLVLLILSIALVILNMAWLTFSREHRHLVDVLVGSYLVEVDPRELAREVDGKIIED